MSATEACAPCAVLDGPTSTTAPTQLNGEVGDGSGSQDSHGFSIEARARIMHLITHRLPACQEDFRCDTCTHLFSRAVVLGQLQLAGTLLQRRDQQVGAALLLRMRTHWSRTFSSCSMQLSIVLVSMSILLS